MKHVHAVLLTGCVIVALLLTCTGSAFAEPDDETPEVTMEDGVSAWLSQMDLHGWQELLSSLPESVQTFWTGTTPEKLVGQFAASSDFTGIFTRLGQSGTAFVRLWKQELPLLLLLTGIGLTSSFCAAILPGGEEESAAKTGGFVCRCFALSAAVAALATRTVDCMRGISSLSAIMEATLPVLYLLLTAMGAVASSGVLQPATALLSGAVTTTVRTLVLPFSLIGGAIALLDGLSGEQRLSGVADFLKKASKWITGGMSALYIGAISIGGLVSASYDSMTVRTARFAASSTLPVIGGMVSGSLDTILGCAVLVKNAAGLTAILLAASAAVVPLLRMLLLAVTLRLSTALIQPVAEKRLVTLYETAAGLLSCLIGAYLAIFFMFLISVGLIMGVFGQMTGGG